MSTLVLDTLEDRVSAKQSSVVDLGNQWIFIDDYTASSDATITFSENGIEQGSPTDFADGYTYRIEADDVYGDVNLGQIYLQLYEGGAYRSASNAYFWVYRGQNNSVYADAQGAATSGFYQSAGMGTDSTNTISTWMEFKNLGSTTYKSQWYGWCGGSFDTAYTEYTMFGRVYTGADQRLAATRIQLSPVTATEITAGVFRLYKRKDT